MKQTYLVGNISYPAYVYFNGAYDVGLETAVIYGK